MAAPGEQPRVGENRLLAALPQEDYQRLVPELETVQLAFRQVLYEAGQPIRDVYFLRNAVVSMISVMEDGTAVEFATVGNEGLVGLPVFLGAVTAPHQTFCQIPGEAARLRADVFRAEAQARSSLHDLAQRYTQALFSQVAQHASCNRVHSIEQRCARWLLMTHDRVGADEFPLTQEFLAHMLGVRRAGVNAAAGLMKKAGFIRYVRGRVTIVDRPGLESASCECYRVIKLEFERLLGAGPSPERSGGAGDDTTTAHRPA